MNTENNSCETTDVLYQITQSFNNMNNTISGFKKKLNLLNKQFKDLEKKTKKHVRKLESELRKKSKRTKKEPSGFAKPNKISNELCSFLKKPNGTEMARTEVTQHLIQYIKDKNLQNKQNGKFIIPDEKLIKLLDINEDTEITYFNLQSYMNKHFV